MKTYEPYSWLWLDNRQQYLDYFLRFSRNLNDEEKEFAAQSPDNLTEIIKEKSPVLSDFKREIDYFMDLYKKCNLFDDEKIMCRWLRINTKPFKQAVLNIICKWANILKQHLVDQVNTR